MFFGASVPLGDSTFAIVGGRAVKMPLSSIHLYEPENDTWLVQKNILNILGYSIPAAIPVRESQFPKCN